MKLDVVKQLDEAVAVMLTDLNSANILRCARQARQVSILLALEDNECQWLPPTTGSAAEPRKFLLGADISALAAPGRGGRGGTRIYQENGKTNEEWVSRRSPSFSPSTARSH